MIKFFIHFVIWSFDSIDSSVHPANAACCINGHQTFPDKQISLNNSGKIKDIAQYILVVWVFLSIRYGSLGQP